MEYDKISVIIPFYSGANWLMEAIESVFSQNYYNIEIIIINDGSSENITHILEKYKNKIIYINQENKGAAAARNIGIDVCTGEYVAFLDSDDIWMQEKLQKQINHMKKTGDVWSHTNYLTFGNNLHSKTIDVSEYNGNIFPLCVTSCLIATPCVMIKASILKENKDLRFGEELKYGEDLLLWINLALKYKISFLDEVLTKVRIRGTNAALLAYSQIRARAQIWDIIREKRLFEKNKEINLLIKYAYITCKALYSILKHLRKDNSTKISIVEIISKILYILPWLVFKWEKKRILRKDR